MKPMHTARLFFRAQIPNVCLALGACTFLPAVASINHACLSTQNHMVDDIHDDVATNNTIDNYNADGSQPSTNANTESNCSKNNTTNISHLVNDAMNHAVHTTQNKKNAVYNNHVIDEHAVNANVKNTDTDALDVNDTDAHSTQNTITSDAQKNNTITHDINRTNTRGSNTQTLIHLYQKSPHSCQGSWVLPANMTPTHDSFGNNLGNNRLINADYGYYDNVDFVELSGNALIVQNQSSILANTIAYNTQTKTVHAKDDVLFGQQKTDGLIGAADDVLLNESGEAIAQNIAFASNKLGMHGYAKDLKATQNTYQMHDVSFSLCPPDNKLWHIDAKQITLDGKTGRSVSLGNTFYVKNTPIFYLPYLNMPLSGNRNSGFLMPSIKIGSQNGLSVNTPLYVNLAPNYDATITPSLQTNNNPMLHAQFRYLSRFGGQGQVDGAYIKDKHMQKNRHHLHYMHDWRYTKDSALSANVDLKHASDGDYLNDFDFNNLGDNTLNLSQNINIHYQKPNIYANLAIEDFLRFEGYDARGQKVLDKQRPYARLPALSVHYNLRPFMSKYAKRLYKNRDDADSGNAWQKSQHSKTYQTHPLVQNLSLDMQSHSGYFKKKIADDSEPEKSGIRAYHALNISTYMPYGSAYIRPNATLAHLYTAYDEKSTVALGLNKQNKHRTIFSGTASLEGGMHFQKQGAPKFLSHFGINSNSKAILTPKLKYVYSPHIDQSTLPNFSTTFAPLSYEQLLEDSWLLGYDRLNDMHAITPAVDFAYLNDAGRKTLSFNAAQQFYLSNKTTIGAPNHVAHSGLVMQANFSPNENIGIDMAGALMYNRHPSNLSISAYYRPNTPSWSFIDTKNSANTDYANTSNKSLHTNTHNQALYRIGFVQRQKNDAFHQKPISALNIGISQPFSQKWQLIGYGQYNLKQHKIADALLGVGYNDCCIGVSVYARQYQSENNPAQKPVRGVMAEVRLNKSHEQSKLLMLAKQKILGLGF